MTAIRNLSAVPSVQPLGAGGLPSGAPHPATQGQAATSQPTQAQQTQQTEVEPPERLFEIGMKLMMSLFSDAAKVLHNDIDKVTQVREKERKELDKNRGQLNSESM